MRTVLLPVLGVALLAGAAGAAKWKPSVDLTAPAAAPDHVLTVHAITHTHDDVGWLQTVDGYYESVVRSIITNVVKSLAANPTRRYTYVEIAFFSKWWDEQNNETKETVKKLVNEGRLDFTIGGWCMPDEASTTYTDHIDSMTAGHLWLKETFGDIAAPKAGWQIDPFGHSNGNSWLYKQYGFESNVVCRIDHQDISWRRANTQMEFIWRPFRSFDNTPETQDLFTTTLFDGYCWPGGRTGSGSNPAYNTDAFVNGIYNVYKSFSTPEVPITLGCDFEWSNAEAEFKALETLMAYLQAHPEKKINLIFSTPKTYAAAVKKYGLTYSIKKDDFFPYADYTDDYWSGYFTSHPAFKRSVRASSALFHSARVLHGLTVADDEGVEALKAPWRAIGVVQHHDAITGTSKAFVYDDYLKQLAAGDVKSIEVMNSVFNLMTGDNWKACGATSSTSERNVACSDIISGSEYVAVANPLGWKRTEHVTLLVKDQNTCVYLPNKTVLVSQTRPVADGFELDFVAQDVAPLGISSFLVAPCQVKSVEAGAAKRAVETIKNEFLTATFTDGQLTEIFDKTRSLAVPITSEILYYVPENSEWSPRSGAYVFAANTAPQQFPGTRATKKFSGSLYEEMEITHSSSSKISQSYRLNAGENFMRMSTSIGPIDVSDNYGKEVIIRLTAKGIKTDGKIYTDSHGLEFVAHQYNKISDKWTVENPISGNYYPVTTAAYISDPSTTIAVITDRAQGFASLTNNSIEGMIHRRLLTDGDNKGVGEALNDATAITTSQIVSVVPTKSALRTIRTASLLKEHPFAVFHIPSEGAAPITWKPLYTTEMPKNVHITTLQAQAGMDAPTLVRLTNIYAVGEDAELSADATVDLATIFTGTWAVVGVDEMNLSANTMVGSLPEGDFSVALHPMQTRTFLVHLHRKCLNC